MISEKRKYLRFLAKDNAYVILGNHFNKVGRLKDISIAGLAFTYFESTEDRVRDFSKATIFVSDSKYYIPDLDCRMIYDTSLDETNNKRYYNTAFRTKSCGIQFTAITEYQLQKLKFFIHHHARRLTIS
jgi:hypothetical protein